ncbi:MAG TPA: hypothetical protein IAA15_05075 [Candidatus Olsenella pullicola]|nr:hypothetical protein [Candidatus Olsenella pullicola]
MASRDDILGALRHALTPPAPALAALVAVAAAGLAWTFLLGGNQDTPVAYLSYAISAYALVAVCASVAAARPLERLHAALPANPLVDRIVSDADFRAKLSFSASSVLRVVWCVFNAVMGVTLQSAWYVTLAVYYLFLSIMRGSLVRHLRGGEGEAVTRGEILTQRRCGIMLIVTTVMLAGMTVLLNSHEGGFVYEGYLIYAMAAWTFYTLISCVVRFVRVRRSEGAGLFLSSAYAVRLAEVLVSLFALEVAMLAAFSTPGQETFNMVTINATGAVILVILVLTGAELLRRANRALRSPAEVEGR